MCVLDLSSGMRGRGNNLLFSLRCHWTNVTPSNY